MIPRSRRRFVLTAAALHRSEILRAFGGPIVSGFLLAASFPPWNFTLLAWGALAPWGWAMRSRAGGWWLLVGGFLGGFVFHLSGMYWIQASYDNPSFLSARTVGWVASAEACSVCMAICLVLGRAIALRAAAPMFVILPAVWTTFEYARWEIGRLPSDFPYPWLRLGLTQADWTWFLQTADFGGLWILSFWIAFFNGALVDFLHSGHEEKYGVRRKTAVVAVSVVFALLAVYGAWSIDRFSAFAEPGLRVGLMPSAAGKGNDAIAWGEYVGAADLWLWAEGDFGELDETNSSAGEVGLERWIPADNLAKLSKRLGAVLAVGCARRDDAGRRYNSLGFFHPIKGLVGYYDKQFPVPWREFTPRLAVEFLDQLPMGVQPGGASPPMLVSAARQNDSVLVGGLVCYDVCFPSAVRSYLQSPTSRLPEIFVVASAEGFDPSLSIQQYLLRMCRVRAVEFRRSLVRNVSWGICGLVAPTGELISTATDANGLAGRPPTPYLLPPAPLERCATLYSHFGDWLPIACILLSIYGLLHRWPPHSESIPANPVDRILFKSSDFRRPNIP
jgi:apolipoprotein N-acyltransferase